MNTIYMYRYMYFLYSRSQGDKTLATKTTNSENYNICAIKISPTIRTRGTKVEIITIII